MPNCKIQMRERAEKKTAGERMRKKSVESARGGRKNSTCTKRMSGNERRYGIRRVPE